MDIPDFDVSQPQVNALGQPVNFAVPDWVPPPVPEQRPLQGHFCRVEPLNPEVHAASLYAANSRGTEGRMWTYLSYGPFKTFESYRSWLDQRSANSRRLCYAIVDAATNSAIGVACYFRINPAAGSIEVGGVTYSPLLQGTVMATEAMYLMMDNVFRLGYRRYEWTADTMNAASRAAAQRLGFSFEGIFRQENVVKGRNRDTAWYSILNHEWPALRAVFQQWLAPQNFDAEGRQHTRLSDLTWPLLHNVVESQR